MPQSEETGSGERDYGFSKDTVHALHREIDDSHENIGSLLNDAEEANITYNIDWDKVAEQLDSNGDVLHIRIEDPYADPSLTSPPRFPSPLRLVLERGDSRYSTDVAANHQGQNYFLSKDSIDPGIFEKARKKISSRTDGDIDIEVDYSLPEDVEYGIDESLC
ncbi:MAG: hypothetical protein ABEJ93_04715 [Candidatus Nanohalobium sp.]